MPEQNQTRSTIHLPREKGKILSLFRNARTILSVCEAMLNLRILQKYGDGTNVLPAQEAQVTISDGYLTVILPSVSQPGGGGSSGMGSGVFGGVGSPSAATLEAGTYLTVPTPSFYVDTSTGLTWYCSTAGTAATSAWTKTSAGGGNMNWQGLWIAGTTAQKNDVWILQSGTATGTYLCTVNGNTNSPDTAVNWVQIGTNLGQWQ